MPQLQWSNSHSKESLLNLKATESLQFGFRLSSSSKMLIVEVNEALSLCCIFIHMKQQEGEGREEKKTEVRQPKRSSLTMASLQSTSPILLIFQVSQN